MRTLYELGQDVYLKTDPEQLKRMVVQIRKDFNGIVYVLVCGPETTIHFEAEISDSPDIMMTSTN